VLVHFAKFDPDLCTEPRNLVVVKVDPTHAPMRFKFVSAHEELETILGRPLTGTELDGPGAEGFGSIEESYRRCAKSGLPVYDFMRMNFGDEENMVFERIILPYASSGRTADHLVVIVKTKLMQSRVRTYAKDPQHPARANSNPISSTPEQASGGGN
jgi:hypothetical protein